MNDHLDRTVRTVLADIVATTPTAEPQPIHLVPLEHDVRGRRPVFAIAAALVVVAAIAGGLYVFSRQGGDGTAATSPSQLDGLLYPADMSVTQLQRNPTPPGSRIGIGLVSPSHRFFSVNVMANFWSTLPADYQQRTINGTIVGAGLQMGTMNYTALTSCLMVSITDHTTAATAWSAEATSLLNGLSVDGAHGSMHLPVGWTSLSGEWLYDMYAANFTTTKGSRAVLFQMQASLGSLASQVSFSSAEPTTFDGRPAWVFLQGDTGWLFLGWQRPEGGAALLGVDGGTADELLALAAQMTTGHGVEWSRAHGGSSMDGTTATTASKAAACDFDFGVS